MLLENIVQNKIGHLEYGIFAALYALGYLFITFSDLGINMYTTKKVAREPEVQKEIFSHIFGVKVLLSLLYPIFMAAVGFLLGYEAEELYFLAILSFTQALLQILLFFRSNFQARQSFRLDSIVSVSDKAILILIVLFLVYHRLTLETYIYSRLISAVITILIFYLVLIKMYGWIKPVFNPEKIRSILSLSIPFAIMTVLYSLNEKIDQVMLERIGAEAEARVRAGLYAGAYRWLEAFQMYLWTVMPFYFAKFAFYHKDPRQLQKVLNMGQVVSTVPMIFVSIFVFFHAEKLFWLFSHSTPQEIAIMANTCRILFLATFLNGFSAIYGNLLSCMGLEKKISRIVIISTSLNVILNFIFIPRFGTYAAAWSTFASMFFLTLAYLLMVRKELTIKVPYDIIAKLLAVSLLLAGAFWALDQTPIPWYASTAISGIVLILLCFIFRLNRFLKLKE